MRAVYLVISIIICSCFISCQKEKVIEGYITETGPNKIISEGTLLPNTIAVDEEQEFFLTQIDSVTYTLDSRATIAESLQVGSVFGGGLTEKFPQPYLIYIEEISEDGNSLILKVRRAGLLEAFNDLYIDLELTESLVETREAASISQGPFSLSLTDGNIDFDPNVTIDFDKFNFEIKADINKGFEVFRSSITGFEFTATLQTDISGTLSGSSTYELPAEVKGDVTVLISGIPIVISNQLIFSLTAAATGTGNLSTLYTLSTQEKMNIEVEYDGIKFNTSTNVTDASWPMALPLEVIDANGSLSVDITSNIEWQITLYKLFALGHLYFNLQPVGLSIITEKNPQLPQIDIRADLIGKADVGMRGGLNLDFLFKTGDNGFLAGLDFSKNLVEETIKLYDDSVPISCPLDIGESSIIAVCDLTEDNIELQFRWDAGPSVSGQYFLEVGGNGGNFFNFNEDQTWNVNPSVFGNSSVIILEHEDRSSCSHRYVITNPCFIDAICPNGNCWTQLADGKTWATKNLSNTDKGVCHPSDTGCNILGEYFTAEELLDGDAPGEFVQGLCPNGWHIPSFQDYQDLLAQYPGSGINALLTPGLEGISEWSPSLASGFSAIPSGAYHPWVNDEIKFEGSLYEDDDRFLMYWTSDKLLTNTTIRIDLESKNVQQVASAVNLKAACRCVKN